MQNSRNRPRAISMKDLAIAAGVSQSTVSLALRQDPRVAAGTRERVQALARELGYRPDPALSALVAYRARTRPTGDYGKIAVLHDWKQIGNRVPPSLRISVGGIEAGAAALGYEIEPFQVRADDPAGARRLSRTLHHRGIRGLILIGLRMPELTLEWEHFSAVAIGEYFSSPRLNHVNHHHHWVLSTTYQELRALGYRRIGFCNSRISEERKHFLYLGAYLKCLFLDGLPSEDLPPFIYDEKAWDPLPWLDAHGFDAVMCQVPGHLLEKLQAAGRSVPEEVGVAGFSIPLGTNEDFISGCTLDYARMGYTAVEVLQSMMHHGQRGVPAENEQYDILIRGQWRAGTTVRAKDSTIRDGLNRPGQVSSNHGKRLLSSAGS